MTDDSILNGSAGRPPILGASYWIQRARMTRSKAGTINDPRLQERLRRVALEYDRLAVRATPAPTIDAPTVPDDEHVIDDHEQLSLAL